MNTKKAINKHHRIYRERKTAQKRISTQLKGITRQNRFNREAREILQGIAQQVQQTTHSSISRIVTDCLRLAFPDKWKFKLEFVKKRGKTEALLEFWKGGIKIDPNYESSGGVLDVAAFGLRLACVMLQPDIRKCLILDEPFKMVGNEDAERVRDMLLEVSNKLKVQIIMITHNPKWTVGNVIELKRK